MKNIIKTSKKLIVTGLATISTLSMLTAVTATPAAAEGEAHYQRQHYNNHGHYGHKYRSHKKHYKRLKKTKRVRRHATTNHYYSDNTYKHRRKHSKHYNDYHYDNDNNAAIAAGIIGFAIGTIVGSCLLYTSPSPRDLSTSRMPSSA